MVCIIAIDFKMKIKKAYTFTNNRQIWRVIPTNTGKIVIEDRDTEAKQAFFSCIDLESGKDIFRNFQLDEKFWSGIEIIKDDIIYFHKYAKPDMPQHKGIIAFDLNEQKVLWENNNYTYLFVNRDEVYCYTSKFEGRNYFILNRLTGELLNDFGSNSEQINLLKDEAVTSQEFEGYTFPQSFFYGDNSSPAGKILQELKTEKLIVGLVDFIEYNNLLLISTFEPNDDGTLNNVFRAIDIDSGKVIFEEVLNNQARTPVPESFFMKSNLIFMLKEKNKLMVCAVNQ